MKKEDFSEKYHIYAGMLYKIALIYLGNIPDAEEILQEVFIKLCYHAPKFQNQEHEKAWLIRVTVNHCKNYLKTVWKKRVEQREDLSEYSQQEQDRELLALVISLPEKYKAVIYLHYYENYKVSEIAGILKLSESAVKMRLQRGREMLRMELQK